VGAKPGGGGDGGSGGGDVRLFQCGGGIPTRLTRPMARPPIGERKDALDTVA
jgi:hypothetical protein